jgi:phosphohistidine phosphatase
MKLYLVRHADAVPVEQFEGSDAERPLTEVGVGQAQALAAALQTRKVTFDQVVTSPLLRARQTAAFLLTPAGPETPPAEAQWCDDLAFGGKRRRLAKYLVKLGKESVALVGHQPDLGELAAWLIGSRKARVELAKGAAAFIECDGEPDKGAGTLHWLLTPEWVAPVAAGTLA